MANAELHDRVQTVRQFNRFYTQQMGILQEHLLGSEFSLTEVRVLYELAHGEELTAKQVGDDLGLDAGYLSRMLRAFAGKGLIERRRCAEDGRQVLLSLSRKGRAAFEPLNEQSNREVRSMLRRLPEEAQEKLVQALKQVERTLSPSRNGMPALVLRNHRPGDMGWVIQRHGSLYAEEYGWDTSFEALVAEIAAQFLKNFDSRRERCWIAERDGQRVGSVFLVKHTDQVAKLRLLLVEPYARGLGVGRTLVEQCIQFAREARYSKLTLWTQSILLAARGIYQDAGFKLVKEEPQRAFGAELVSETWELEL